MNYKYTVQDPLTGHHQVFTGNFPTKQSAINWYDKYHDFWEKRGYCFALVLPDTYFRGTKIRKKRTEKRIQTLKQ